MSNFENDIKIVKEPKQKIKKWAKEETRLLASLVNQFNKINVRVNWSKISACFPGSNENNCRLTYRYYIRKDATDKEKLTKNTSDFGCNGSFRIPETQLPLQHVEIPEEKENKSPPDELFSDDMYFF